MIKISDEARKAIKERCKLTDKEWLEDFLIRNKVDNLSFTINTNATSKEQLLKEFRRLETTSELGFVTDLPEVVVYVDPELDRIIDSLPKKLTKPEI